MRHLGITALAGLLVGGCNWVIGLPDHELAGQSNLPFGELETLVTDQHGPQDVAVDDTDLFWLDRAGSDTVVRRAAKGAPGTVENVAEGVYEGLGLELDGTHVYFIAGTDGGHTYVHRVGKSGSPWDRLYDNGSGTAKYTAFAVAATTLVWAEKSEGVSGQDLTNPMNVNQGSTDGAQATIVLTGEANGVRDVELDRGRAFYSNSGTGEVLRVLPGEEPEAVIGDLLTVSEIEAGGGLLFAVTDTGQLRRWELDGSEDAELVSDREDGPRGLSTDGTFVYWANLGSGEVRALPINGTTPQTIASGIAEPFDTAADDQHVYVADRGGGAIHRIAKP